MEAHGTVSCHADLEGVVPDISLTLAVGGDQETPPLDHVIYHLFVQSTEMQGYFMKGWWLENIFIILLTKFC